VRNSLTRAALRASAGLKRALDSVAAGVAITLLKGIRRTDLTRIARFSGRALRAIGPWLPEQRTGRANLAAAFPEKSPQEIDEILARVWENLGRVGAEYAHLDRIVEEEPGRPRPASVQISPLVHERFLRMREDGKPALLFAAHIGNWELPATMAAANHLDTAIVYRQPNIAGIARAIEEIRAGSMGELIPASGMNSVFRMANALERGAHVGMLVDQHFSRGVDVMFFGRMCKANPLIARLARRFECPIHGTRAVRLPGHRFRLDLTEEVRPARDAEGKVDVTATMQIITSIIEGWVRENPDQWLWLHRRWR
jgi:KDO2-lipid IV(A) lauroyltransferase